MFSTSWSIRITDLGLTGDGGAIFDAAVWIFYQNSRAHLLHPLNLGRGNLQKQYGGVFGTIFWPPPLLILHFNTSRPAVFHRPGRWPRLCPKTTRRTDALIRYIHTASRTNSAYSSQQHSTNSQVPYSEATWFWSKWMPLWNNLHLYCPILLNAFVRVPQVKSYVIHLGSFPLYANRSQTDAATSPWRSKIRLRLLHSQMPNASTKFPKCPNTSTTTWEVLFISRVWQNAIPQILSSPGTSPVIYALICIW